MVGRSANYALRRQMTARTAGVECFIGSDDEEHCSGSSGLPEPVYAGDAEISDFCAGPVNGCKQRILRELLCSVFFWCWCGLTRVSAFEHGPSWLGFPVGDIRVEDHKGPVDPADSAHGTVRATSIAVFHLA